ncbi:MAG: hypothetical protein HYT70_04580 [Candidatus Aenigmarchaeota archaeon]|nr:hypothetical protein [Candidatus Aenigmarchaeota archaeon]
MDLIHPVEILVQILKADLDELTDARTYIVKPEYDSKNPSAVQVIYKVSGSKFAKDAVATIKLGKGFDMASDKKIMRLYFEDGTFIEFEYLNTEEELATGKRGSWKLFKSEEGGAKLLESKEVQGLLSYETLINEVVKILQGGEMPLTLDEIKRMYESEWQFQEISKDLKPITDKEEIKKLTEGI